VAGLRPPLLDVVARLTKGSREGDVVSIDVIGAALGTLSITPPEIEELFTALEKAGRRIGAPEGANGESNLKKVVAAARALREEKPNHKPAVAEIAERASLGEGDVKLALALLRVMQR
jgi:hypothetical protein